MSQELPVRPPGMLSLCTFCPEEMPFFLGPSPIGSSCRKPDVRAAPPSSPGFPKFSGPVSAKALTQRSYDMFWNLSPQGTVSLLMGGLFFIF